VAAYWMGIKVSDASFSIERAADYPIPCDVYDLTVDVGDVFGVSIPDADVRVYWPDGTIAQQGKTGVNGKLTFVQLPRSGYTVRVSYLWQTASDHVSLTGTMTRSVKIPLSMLALEVLVGTLIVSAFSVAWILKRRRKG